MEEDDGEAEEDDPEEFAEREKREREFRELMEKRRRRDPELADGSAAATRVALTAAGLFGDVSAHNYDATTFDALATDRMFTGSTSLYEISVNHRLAFVTATDLVR